MKKNAKIAAERLNKVLLSDKIAHPDKFNDLLRAELSAVLSDYFEILPETYYFKMYTDGNLIRVQISVGAARIKQYGNFITSE
jgi:Septum formation topological specificity factor MinE.